MGISNHNVSNYFRVNNSLLEEGLHRDVRMNLWIRYVFADWQVIRVQCKDVFQKEGIEGLSRFLLKYYSKVKSDLKNREVHNLFNKSKLPIIADNIHNYWVAFKMGVSGNRSLRYLLDEVDIQLGSWKKIAGDSLSDFKTLKAATYEGTKAIYIAAWIKYSTKNMEMVLQDLEKRLKNHPQRSREELGLIIKIIKDSKYADRTSKG